MYCPKCGTELDGEPAFCYKCGAKIKEDAAGSSGKEHETTDSQQNVSGSEYNISESVKQGAYKARDYTVQYASRFGADKVIGIIAAFFLLLNMVMPFTFVRFWGVYACTLFGSLSHTMLVVYGGGWKALFIIAYLAFIGLFIVGKFVGKSRTMCLTGCAGSWLMFILAIIEVIATNGAAGYAFMTMGFGMYFWIIAGILAIISVCIDKRKSVGNPT